MVRWLIFVGRTTPSAHTKITIISFRQRYIKNNHLFQGFLKK